MRVYVRVARFALRGSVELTARTLSLATHMIRSVTPSGSAEAPRRSAPESVATAEPGDAAGPVLDTIAPAPAPAPATPLRAEPVRVSEEPVLVEEFAEPGAEDGAGAEVTVTEPWEGYAAMTAQDVIARLAGAVPAELAAVQLYETSHRRRTTVITAVERELRAKSASSAPAADQSRKEHTDG